MKEPYSQPQQMVFYIKMERTICMSHDAQNDPFDYDGTDDIF